MLPVADKGQAAQTFKVGTLVIEAPWARATPGGAQVGGGYMKITNTGKDADRLIGGSLPIAGEVEVHEMAMTGNVMKMRRLADGLEIKPGESVELKPGGNHLMFMGLRERLESRAGDQGHARVPEGGNRRGRIPRGAHRRPFGRRWRRPFAPLTRRATEAGATLSPSPRHATRTGPSNIGPAPMLTFTVHEPPNPPADRIDRAESLVFVKDGFSWMAALFCPDLAAGAPAVVAVAGLRRAERPASSSSRWSAIVDPGWVMLAGIALHLLIGFEADTLRRSALDRRGWQILGSVSGRNAAECERRFYEGWLPTQPVIAPVSGPPPLVGAPTRRTPVIGSLLGARS